MLYFCANPTDGHYFHGRLDDVRHYNRVLSPDEVRALYLETRRD